MQPVVALPSSRIDLLLAELQQSEHDDTRMMHTPTPYAMQAYLEKQAAEPIEEAKEGAKEEASSARQRYWDERQRQREREWAKGEQEQPPTADGGAIGPSMPQAASSAASSAPLLPAARRAKEAKDAKERESRECALAEQDESGMGAESFAGPLRPRMVRGPKQRD
jgi:hypothetical protein